MKSTFLLVPLFFLIFFSAFGQTGKSAPKPNIILIYADDLGIGLLGHEGQEIIKTPNIDRLAAEGLRFQRAYSNMLCAPARASLLTGLTDTHANSFEITNGGIYNKIGSEQMSSAEVQKTVNDKLSPITYDQVFLGEVAKSTGYVTAQVGKLEWGFSATDQQMKRHGWDYYFGYLDHQRAHGFYPPYLFENGALVEIDGNTLLNSGKSGEPETAETYKERWDMEGKKQYSQTLFMDKVLSFITTTKDQPFFLYFPTQLPHGPVSIPAVHPDFENDERLTQIEKEYASMVKLLDDNVGKILQKLEELGIDENTLVIFTSDNGHEIYYSQAGRTLKPYTNMETGERFDDYERKYYSELAGDVFDGNGGRAGLKRSNLQGGINVPLLIRWPGKIQAGRISERLVANYDILPTIAALVGYSKDFKTDGISFYPELLGKSEENAHEFVVYSSFIGPSLITNEGWKIRTHLPKGVFELFYLPDDFREENDLSAKFPEKLEELKSKLLEACDGDLKNGHYGSGRSQIRL
ncbi:arylsulfatase [Algoriphagus halophytocola]|uniref:Arylsulfatase n=1 Tax=Algoriphagus halophytocola TaxID=2991499 RepID=A0ABY6MIB3_9BACT|nr:MULTISPECIES: arylsulfatase [unclassified Algoriphagus]UZD23209.1 arylsulfatase [Algoriphagus sp. TR-M5]WBL44502.1 arylsulfatase [Algoriphagus sp. TR-M9]